MLFTRKIGVKHELLAKINWKLDIYLLRLLFRSYHAVHKVLEAIMLFTRKVGVKHELLAKNN